MISTINKGIKGILAMLLCVCLWWSSLTTNLEVISSQPHATEPEPEPEPEPKTQPETEPQTQATINDLLGKLTEAENITRELATKSEELTGKTLELGEITAGTVDPVANLMDIMPTTWAQLLPPPPFWKRLHLPSSIVPSMELTNVIQSKELGWAEPPPAWLMSICPETVQHFLKFPGFKYDDNKIAISTSMYAAKTTCTTHIVQSIALAVGAHLYLHAGSHLGAVLHGQVIPWDDDADGMIPFAKQKEFLDECDRISDKVHPNVTLHCKPAHNAIKVWIQLPGQKKETSKSKPWYSPFFDLFMYKLSGNCIQEIDPKGRNSIQKYKYEDYYPTRPFYFGGLWIMGPKSSLASRRYSLNKCMTGSYGHRLEVGLPKRDHELRCEDMAMMFPFVYQANVLSNRRHSLHIFPERATVYDVPWHTSIDTRKKLAKAPTDRGQNLTAGVPNLDFIEVDNSIAAQNTCVIPTGHTLKVIEYNAERGRNWMAAVPMLADADIIILNEMDIGMSRSDQQHTTRLLAFMLGMNYAWGLEFMELTTGTKQEHADHGRIPNFHGLHGNAFLTRCKISDPVLFRDPVGPYFDDTSNSYNAGGYERRLGGRMGIFGRIQVGNQTMVVGSTHKLQQHSKKIRAYIGQDKAITAGDQDRNFCHKIGLQNIDNKQHNTWPVSCSRTGTGRGDNFCSNFEVTVQDTLTLPCHKRFGTKSALSDHAIIAVGIQV